MEIANVRVRLDKVGSDVPVMGCTPAEAIVLHIIHQNNNGGSTFGEEMDKIDILPGEAEDVETLIPAERDEKGNVTKAEERIMKPRTDVSELNRLKRKYGGLTNKKGDKVLNLIFPDKMNPRLPEKFSDLKWRELAFDGTEVASSDFGTSGGLAISQ